jgi:hypothetical protein
MAFAFRGGQISICSYVRLPINAQNLAVLQKYIATKARDLSHRDEVENGFEPSQQGAKHQ